MILPGVVKKLMTYGVFIEFSTGIFGLAPNSVSIMNVRHGLAHGRLPTDRLSSYYKRGDVSGSSFSMCKMSVTKERKKKEKERNPY